MLPLFDSQPTVPLAEMACRALENGSVIVTANARSARALTFLYAEEQRAKGIEMWPSPQIFDWENWLNHLWQQISTSDPAAPLLLTPWQERMLWKMVQQADAALVVSTDGIAAMAQSAYALLSDYRRHGERNTTWLETDAEHFRQWAKAFDQRCRERNWTSRSELASLLSRAIRAGRIALPAQILLIGFDRFTPAQQILLQSLREAGVIAEDSPAAPPEAKSRTQIVADDLQQELAACAWWCRKQIEEKGPIRIGVIAPDVSEIRAEAERVFRSVLMPESLDLSIDSAPMPFEFSLGVPLKTVPAIRAALLLLKWTTSPLTEEEISWLLLSGFLHRYPAEAATLARFDFRQRAAGALSPEATLKTFLSNHVPSFFATRMKQVLEAVKHGSSTYSQWADLADTLLQIAAWPGYFTPDSIQFQAVQRWNRLLDEVTLLDFAGRNVTLAAFVQVLEKQAQETIFTAESHHGPIQILGALESSGQIFDAMWFLGADDSHWPLSGKPHPLLPKWLQRSAGMPHSSTGIDTDLARVVTQRLAESSPECVFSYARQNKEGELRVSPLLSSLFPRKTEIVPASTLLSKQPDNEQTEALETLQRSSQVVAWPAELSAGGSEVLKRQAACPFQSFAARRLQARPLLRTEWGLDARQRGSLLHAVLENIWSPKTPEPWCMTTLDDLKRVVSEQRLDEALRFHIENVFREYVEEHADDMWMSAYLESEQLRLLTRLREWMLYEAKRQPFQVAEREICLQDVSVGNLKLNLRADRVDTLIDGSHLLIDYKTGDVSVSQWQGSRPDEPQLPLYAAYGNIADVSGLLFARIRAGETEFIGRVAHAEQNLFSDTPSLRIPTNQPYDESMLDQWENTLLQLADEFLLGEASVDPKHRTKTCQYCDFPGLCRIAEESSSFSTGDEGNEDE